MNWPPKWQVIFERALSMANQITQKESTMKNFKRLAITLVVFGMVALGSNAFARMGKPGQGMTATGQEMPMTTGKGMHMGMGKGMHNLTADQLALFQTEKAAFA